MPRKLISQPNQIFSPEPFDDARTVGSGMESTLTLEEDLNNIRTQIRQVLWAGITGSWYSAITAPSGGFSARGLNTINTDLTQLEQHRFLFRTTNLNTVLIGSGTNFALLSVSLGTAPTDYIAHANTIQSGSVVTPLGAGVYGAHSMQLTSGSIQARPKNLVIIRDAWTGEAITDTAIDNKDIYGLLQIETGSLNGGSFNDLTARTQISFVVEYPSGTLTAASPASIGGKHVLYSYPRRTALDDIPEDAYLSDTIFLDVVFTSGSALLTDITRQRAYNNQGTLPVELTTNATLDLGTSTTWALRDVANATLFAVDENSAGSNTKVRVASDVDLFEVSASINSFLQGVRVDAGGTEIRIGETAGTIETLTNYNLLISGGNNLRFADGHMLSGSFTTVAFSSGSGDWQGFYDMFGPGETILGAFTSLSTSLSASTRRTRYTGGTTTFPWISPNTNVTYPTNIDAQLGDYSGKSFVNDVNVYLNGVLLLPGDVTNNNDVYPGTAPATGDLKFPYRIRTGSQISMEIF